MSYRGGYGERARGFDRGDFPVKSFGGGRFGGGGPRRQEPGSRLQ